MQDERHVLGDVLVVNGVADLVVDSVHPIGIGLDVAQHAHVLIAVDAGAKGVRALALFFIKVAAGQDAPDLHAHALIVVGGQLHWILALDHFVEVHAAQHGCFLEE